MECANPNYIVNGIFTHWRHIYERNPNWTYQPVPCSDCVHCRKNRGSDLAFTCTLEAQLYNDNHFITLTKRPSYEKDHPKYEKKEFKNFVKALQRWCYKKHACTPKIYRVHEHGGKATKRSHYHAIVFNLPLHDIKPTPRPDTNHSQTIQNLWKHGNVTVQDVNHATAMYQSLYLDKDLKNGHANSDKKSVSWHSGIGTRYFLKNYKQIFLLGYIPDGERKQKIPRKFLKIAQKHVDALTLTNEQFCWKYSKEHCKKVIKLQNPRVALINLCTINIQPNRELAEHYVTFKNQPRNEEKNEQKLKQILEYNSQKRKLPPDFYLSGQNTIHNQLLKLENKTL